MYKELLVLISGLIHLTSVSANPLANAAEDRLDKVVIYDGAYRKIPYPMGDVSANIGVCTDVVIRSYRTLGVDLQQLVHEDMQANFDAYPDLWGLSRPDSNIDHRRVPNLEVFFTRHAEVLPITYDKKDYQPGDVVSWRLRGSNRPHIGIVSDQLAETGNYKIIHNIGWGPQINDMLFDHTITGHFSYTKPP